MIEHKTGIIHARSGAGVNENALMATGHWASTDTMHHGVSP